MGVPRRSSARQLRGISLLDSCDPSLVQAVVHQSQDRLEECQCEDGDAEFRVWVLPHAVGTVGERANKVDSHADRDDVDEIGNRLEEGMDAEDPGRFDSRPY